MTLMISSNREEMEKGVKAEWIESSAFAGDGTRYWARVSLSDYPDREAALEAAHARAVYLASRGRFGRNSCPKCGCQCYGPVRPDEPVN